MVARYLQVRSSYYIDNAHARAITQYSVTTSEPQNNPSNYCSPSLSLLIQHYCFDSDILCRHKYEYCPFQVSVTFSRFKAAMQMEKLQMHPDGWSGHKDSIFICSEATIKTLWSLYQWWLGPDFWSHSGLRIKPNMEPDLP
jgi:hypothetical protein